MRMSTTSSGRGINVDPANQATQKSKRIKNKSERLKDVGTKFEQEKLEAQRVRKRNQRRKYAAEMSEEKRQIIRQRNKECQRRRREKRPFAELPEVEKQKIRKTWAKTKMKQRMRDELDKKASRIVGRKGSSRKEKPLIIDECVQKVMDKKITIRQMALFLGVSSATAWKYVDSKGKEPRVCSENQKTKIPNIFSEAEEKMFEEHLLRLAEQGFPVTKMDLQMNVYWYLQASERVVSVFNDNMPGEEWIEEFINRHVILSHLFECNTSRLQDAFNEELLNEYMDNLTEIVQDVLPENLWSFDDMNLSDDPRKEKILYRKIHKYPELIKNMRSATTSIMFCGNAVGEVLPPYIVFKSENLCSTWCENGPREARYNRTNRGWFNGESFEDWFKEHLLVRLRKQKGKKVLIGDNLCSHISINVLNICEAENIHFVCLPPNSTEVTHPLDIAFFHPMKLQWGKTICAYAESHSQFSVVPIDQIASLLKKCLDALQPQVKTSLQDAFQKTGIYPSDRQEVIARLNDNLEYKKNCQPLLFTFVGVEGS